MGCTINCSVPTGDPKYAKRNPVVEDTESELAMIVQIVPLQFLAAVLPKSETLGPTTTGKTNIGDIATGQALDGSGEKTFYIYNICDHEDAFHETGNQAISYTTGVPAMIGAAMIMTGAWTGDGVFNMEQMDPDPFMAMLNKHGLPWQVKELAGPLAF